MEALAATGALKKITEQYGWAAFGVVVVMAVWLVIARPLIDKADAGNESAKIAAQASERAADSSLKAAEVNQATARVLDLIVDKINRGVK